MSEDTEPASFCSLAVAFEKIRAMLQKNPESPALDAWILLQHLTGLSRVQLMIRTDETLAPSEWKRLRKMAEDRCQGKPIAYITGVKDFWKHSFRVDESVLIPRPETELLLERALGYLRSLSPDPAFLDVGTGSGCLALSLAAELPGAYAEAWDISPKALKLAESNQQQMGTGVCFRQQDALCPSAWQGEARFHLIISNPPYIAYREAETLPPSVLNWEPHEALFADREGLAFYETLAANGAGLLIGGRGCIMVEIGFQQAAAVRNIFEKHHWHHLEQGRDLAGLDRLIIAYR
ncbi:MAG: peptide chain release factor N(5)-glutamine methyltransferase [Deltaproteobacteria bacterium]|nr:peptide chain release factor N(5)-glutamine methyltransferase [Deltaproteobacteria bacterium]